MLIIKFRGVKYEKINKEPKKNIRHVQCGNGGGFAKRSSGTAGKNQRLRGTLSRRKPLSTR